MTHGIYSKQGLWTKRNGSAVYCRKIIFMDGTVELWRDGEMLQREKFDKVYKAFSAHAVSDNEDWDV